MREQMERRLEELRGEFESGKRAQAELEAKRDELGQTMLRIHGAMQVLHELLSALETAQASASEPSKGVTPVRHIAVG